MIKVNDEIVHPFQFPDHSLHLSLPVEDPGLMLISWHYENDAELFTLICISRHYKRHSQVLFLPYIPHARMDRVKNAEDVFTLKYFCEVINSLNFETVIVTDPHSNVSTALLDRVSVDDASDHIENAIWDFKNTRENPALFFPDEGAMKRYSDMNLGLDFGFGMKKRDWNTGKILGLEIMQKENIIGKDVLIIDDICSRGGTFYHSAKALLEAGAKSVSLYVTHCENTILQGEIFNSDLIDVVYTTRSLVHNYDLESRIIYV